MKKVFILLLFVTTFSLLASLVATEYPYPHTYPEGDWSLLDEASKVIIGMIVGTDCTDACRLCVSYYNRFNPSTCCYGWCTYQNKWNLGGGLFVRTYWPANDGEEEIIAYDRNVLNPFCKDTDMYINVTAPDGKSYYGGYGLIYTNAWAGAGTYTVDYIPKCFSLWHTQLIVYWSEPRCVRAIPV